LQAFVTDAGWLLGWKNADSARGLAQAGATRGFMRESAMRKQKMESALPAGLT
jgi:hypothetical protein